MTHRPSPAAPTPPINAEETLDRALDALVRGDDRALDRLGGVDPTLRSSVEEVFALADLSGFANREDHWTAWGEKSGSRSGNAIHAPRLASPARAPHVVRIGPWNRQHRLRSAALAAVAAVLIVVVGTAALLAVRGDDRHDPQPVMLEAMSGGPTPESTGKLLDLPASTRPLTVASPEAFGYGGMASAGATVARLLATPEFTGVEAVDANAETVAWRLATAWSSAGITAGESGVYFVAAPNQLVAVDPATGADLWQVTLSAPVISMALQDGNLREDVLYVWDESSTMTAIDTGTGKPLWESTTADPGGSQRGPSGPAMPGATPAIGENVVVMVAANGMLNAFDRSSGEIVWSISSFDGIQTRLAINGDRLMVLSTLAGAPDGTPNLTGTGIDLLTGNTDWQVYLSGPLLQPAASEGTFFYLVADAIFAHPGVREITPEYVDYAECCASWPAAEDADTQPAAEVNGGMKVFGIDTATGRAIWSRATNAGSFITVKTIFPQSGGLFAVTSDGQLVWLQRETGGILPEPMDLGGQVVEFIPFSVDVVRYVATMTDGSLVTIRRTQPIG